MAASTLAEHFHSTRHPVNVGWSSIYMCQIRVVCVCVCAFAHEVTRCVYVYMCGLMNPCICVWSVCITGNASLFHQSGSCQSKVRSWDHLTDWCDVVVHSASRYAKTAPLLSSSLGLIITPSSTYNSAPSHWFPISPNIGPVSFPNFIFFRLQRASYFLIAFSTIFNLQYSIFECTVCRLGPNCHMQHCQKCN